VALLDLCQCAGRRHQKEGRDSWRDASAVRHAQAGYVTLGRRG
jgi:hypothetical protein